MRTALVLALLLSSGAAAEASADPAAGRAAGCGAGVSVWEGGEWTDLTGRTWRASNLEGRVVVLDFWATWCAPCLAELPTMRALHRRWAEEEVLLLGVALDGIERSALRTFLHRHEMGWPQLHEPRGEAGRGLAQRFGVTTVPATLVVDPCGAVVARDLHGEALAAAVEGLAAVWRRRGG